TGRENCMIRRRFTLCKEYYHRKALSRQDGHDCYIRHRWIHTSPRVSAANPWDSPGSLSMHASARAFFDEILDYAGLFPPAKLPLENAVQEFHQAHTSRMLAGFVCPTTRLTDLLALEKPRPEGWPFHVVALGRPPSQISEFVASVDADLRAIQDYRQA